MGAALQSRFAALCLDDSDGIADEIADKSIVVKDKLAQAKEGFSTEQKKEEQKVRVQAAEEIHYGSAGLVPKGATGVLLGNFCGTGNQFTFINWDAFPELGRVSVQPERLLPMHDDRPGTYIITREAGVTLTVALSKDVVGILPVGTTVNVVEVVYLKESNRWRGRLEEPVKGWISILASNNGARWAEQPSAGGCSAQNLKPMHRCASSPVQGQSPSRAGGSSHHTVVSGGMSLAPPCTAATAAYSGCAAGSVSNPCSQAGSFHIMVGAQSLNSRASSFQHTVNGDTYSTMSSQHGSFQCPVATSGPTSSIQYARALERPASFTAVGEQQSLSAVSHAPRKLSMDEASLRVLPASAGQASTWPNQPPMSGSGIVRMSSALSQQDTTSPEVLAVLQGIRQQLKGMADQYSNNADNVV